MWHAHIWSPIKIRNYGGMGCIGLGCIHVCERNEEKKNLCLKKSQNFETGICPQHNYSIKGTNGRQKTYEIFHVYCIFYSGFMCQTTVIFGITEDGSLVLNTLALWNYFTCRNFFQNGANDMPSPSRCTLAKATLLAASAARFGPSALKVRSFWMD